MNNYFFIAAHMSCIDYSIARDINVFHIQTFHIEILFCVFGWGQ
jgi:hypothetical protein